MAVLELNMQELQTPRTETSDQLIKKVAKGGGVAFGGNIADRAVRFLLEILLGRVLGAAGYGLYALGYSLTMIGSQISMLGLTNGVVRFVAKYKGVGDIKRVKGTLILAFVISTLASIAVGGSLLFFSGRISRLFNMPELAGVLRAFACALPFYVIMLMVAFSARAFQRITYYTALRNIFLPVANIIIVSGIFLLGFRLLGAVYGFAIASAFSALLGLCLLKRLFPEIISGFKPFYELKKILRFSVPLLFVGFSYLIMGQIDRIMLGYFKTSKDLGIYNAAANISHQPGVIVYSLSCIFSPIISDLHNRRRVDELAKLFKTVTRWGFSLSLPLTLILVLFSKQIVAIFGPEFTSGWLALVVLSLGYLIANATGNMAGYVLQMSGKQDVQFINNLVMVFLNIGLNIWLIRIYGFLGAAIATALSVAVINIVTVIEVHKLLGMQPYETSYYKPLVAGLGAVLSFLFLSMLTTLNSLWIVNLIVFSIVYFLILHLLGLENEDMIVLKSIKRRFTHRR